MARVNIKLHYTMNKAKFPMQKHYYGLRAQDPKLYGTHWFCKHDNQWHTYEEMHEMMKQGIEFSYSNYDHRITCIRKLKRWIRKNPQFKNFVFFMSHAYLGHSVTVTAKVK